MFFKKLKLAIIILLFYQTSLYSKSNTLNNLDAKVCLLVSNNPNCNAVNFAINHNIDFFVYNAKKFPLDEKQIILIDKIKTYEIDLIILAGYMKKIPRNIVKMYENKIMNIHPSLLPKYGGQGYYGIKVHEAVIESKDKVTGVTIHFIDNEYDRGPIIMQVEVPVNDSDDANTLSKKVLEMEYKLYLQVVESFCSNKIQIEKDRVIINE